MRRVTKKIQKLRLPPDRLRKCSESYQKAQLALSDARTAQQVHYGIVAHALDAIGVSIETNSVCLRCGLVLPHRTDGKPLVCPEHAQPKQQAASKEG